MERIEQILEYWFGAEEDDGEVAQQQAKLWWGQDPETDERLRTDFGSLSEQAAAGELDGWAESARGRLALIILLDQLPRAISRGLPEAFGCDARALSLSLQGLELKHDHQLRPIERVFFLLPLEHAEDLKTQDLSVKRFLELEAEVPPQLRTTFGEYVDYAVKHRDVIERFGRFPHRNEILERESTLEEIEFLKQPGSSF
jgi:uncharacterized protein (DUF924 family)